MRPCPSTSASFWLALRALTLTFGVVEETTIRSLQVKLLGGVQKSAEVPVNHTGSFTDYEPQVMKPPSKLRDGSAKLPEPGGYQNEASEAPSEESSADSGDGTQQDDLFASNLVAFVEAMRTSNPKMLRACPAYVVLACLGQVFWAGRRKSFFHLSKVTKAYDEFLSHSWQVATWKKVLLLLMLKNGLPACLVAGFGASLMACLWQVGFLPGYVKPEFEADTPDARHSLGCSPIYCCNSPYREYSAPY